MLTVSSCKLLRLAKINRLHFMLPIFFTIIISIILAYFVLIFAFHGIHSTTLFEGSESFFVAVNISAIVAVSATSLLVFLHYFRKKPELAVRVFSAAFILSGILSTLLFAKLVFIYTNLEAPLILLIVALVTYVGAYFAYLIFVDSLSNRMKNLLFVVCSGALGSFVGVIVPSLPVLGISLCLSLVDLVLIKRKTVAKFVGEAIYERMITQVAFSSREWGIGIGDLTCYSIVVANTSLNFGFIAGGLSMLLILAGSFLSLAITLRIIRVPGLPLSLTLGILPSIVISILHAPTL